MKVLFLDIDGVLNCDTTKERLSDSFGVLSGFVGLDNRLVDRYLSWLKGKDIRVILSSTWRTDQRLMDHLNEHGIFWADTTKLIKTGGTLFTCYASRGQEIDDWLKNHSTVTHVAILDDIGQMKPVGRYLVQTSERLGLQEHHLQMIDKLLEF